MAHSKWSCENCGFWQSWFEAPPSCPVCVDARNDLPVDGFTFLTPDDVDARVEASWNEVVEGVWRFRTTPRIGLDSVGWLVRSQGANVVIDSPPWWSDDALDVLAGLGGADVVVGTHPHAYAALWRLVDRFDPEVVTHLDDGPWTTAFRVTWPADEDMELRGGLRLLRTGGHFPGQVAVHAPDLRALFSGDALKFDVEPEGDGRWRGVSCHYAFHTSTPLSRDAVRRYRDLFAPLDFDTVLTPFEWATGGVKDAALAMYERQLAGRPSVERWELPEAVRAYREGLPAGRLEGQRTDALDRLGLPVYSVTFFPATGAGNGGNGYGADLGEAMVGAHGEVTETAWSWEALGRLPRTMASFAELGEGTAIDPRDTGLPAGSSWSPDDPLTWVAMRVWGGPEERLVPVELAAAQPADLRPGDPGPEAWTTLPISNGMGAGDSVERALSHALLEILQRDGNGLAFRAMDTGVVIDVDEVADPVVTELLERFDVAGVDVTCKLAATDFGIPNVFVVGIDRQGHERGAPIMATACGEAAHPDRERALRKALLEFGAARARKAHTHGPLASVEAISPPGYLDSFRAGSTALEERRALDEMVAWLSLGWDDFRSLLADTVFSVRSHVALSSLPTTPVEGPAESCRFVVERLAVEGFEVLWTPLTPEGHPVTAVKAYVPGLEVETMTYHRIGARNAARLLDRGTGLVGMGEPEGEGRARIRLSPAAEAGLGGPAWLDVAEVDRIVGRLYPLYREPGRHVAPLVAAGVLPRP